MIPALARGLGVDVSRALSAPEARVVKELITFLEARGWRTVRMESGFVPGAGSFGEKGIADYCFIRYSDSASVPGAAIVMWIETKAPNYKPRCNCVARHRDPETGRMKPEKVCRSCGQKRWQAAERARGALVLQVCDVEAFKAWYAGKFDWVPVTEPQADLFEGVGVGVSL